MSTRSEGRTGVVLMTYGSATTAEHVAEFFERIYKGKASAATVQQFEERYRRIGRSPLVDITREQAIALEERLGAGFVVRAGMRHSAPFIDDAVTECLRHGATRLVGIILSPQYSSFIMEGYRTAFMAAAENVGFAAGSAVVAGPWPAEPLYVELLAGRVKASLSELREKYGVPVPVVFTTHSLPRRVVEGDPGYLAQIATTIDAVRAKLDQATEWREAYQSAGHTPEEWLTPDLVDALGELRVSGHPAALVVPVQFLSDHLEVLYDLDIAARAQCEAQGIAYHRIALPNVDPLFIDGLAAVAGRIIQTQLKTSLNR